MQEINEAAQLANTAKKLLAELNVYSILCDYCDPHLIGAVPAGLVVDLDIDISCFINRDLTLDEYMELAKRLVEIPEVKILRIRDQRDNPNYSPFKLNIDELYYDNKKWKIALSFILGNYDKNAENQKLIEELKNLPADDKLLILKLKKDLLESQKYKIPSYYIYKGVLSKKVTNIDELKEFSEVSGKSL